MIKVYEVSRKYVMLFVFNSMVSSVTYHAYLTSLKTSWCKQICHGIFNKYVVKYFRPKNSLNFTTLNPTNQAVDPNQPN